MTLWERCNCEFHFTVTKPRLRDDNSLAQVRPSSKQRIWGSRTCWLFSRTTLCPVAQVADLYELAPQAPLDLANGKHSRRGEAGRREKTGYLSSVHTGLALAVVSFFNQGHGFYLSTSRMLQCRQIRPCSPLRLGVAWLPDAAACGSVSILFRSLHCPSLCE